MKDIKNYEGIYAVTEDGRVWSYKNKRFLSPGNTGKGYLQVKLCKDGKRENHFIHRLVAQHYLANPNNYSEVNHLDEDKSNNSLENLEWCDHTQNVRYSVNKSVYCPELNRTFDSIIQASNELHISDGNICSCLKGRRSIAGGYHFEYI